MKVYDTKNFTRVCEYYGCWYIGECNPQPLYLYMDGKENDVWISHGSIGGSISYGVFHGKTDRYLLTVDLMSIRQGDHLMIEIANLYESARDRYEESYDGNNWKGFWDEDIRLKIEKFIENYFSKLGEPTIAWDVDNCLEND